MMRIRLGNCQGISESTPVIAYHLKMLGEGVELIIPHSATGYTDVNQNERLPFSSYFVIKLCAAYLSETARQKITYLRLREQSNG